MELTLRLELRLRHAPACSIVRISTADHLIQRVARQSMHLVHGVCSLFTDNPQSASRIGKKAAGAIRKCVS
ncbi:hypothetical protein AB395_00006837 (plasmid) [Sinorhizobium fredii CCBAU 45436]|nr:hypothetical protein AB395_00006837 [Sinorhizobium fredii CCBAU 45436]